MSFKGATLSWEVRDTVAEVRLHRAPCNEIGRETLEELEHLVAWLGQSPEGVRALIFHSEQPGFCAGADLGELHRGLVERRMEGRPVDGDVRDFIDRIHTVFDALDTAPLTTISAVHGVCFGGGLELALTSDLIVADKSARFCFPELRLGLVPGFGGIPRLNRDVGNGVVRDLLFTGRSLNAKRAHALGLVSQVVPRGEALGASRRVAAQAARFDAHTLAAAKAFSKRLPVEELAQERDLFCQLMTKPAVSEALRRFVESDDVRPYLP
jgi:enoyl-CoA hydratase/carnithine racemase